MKHRRLIATGLLLAAVAFSGSVPAASASASASASAAAAKATGGIATIAGLVEGADYVRIPGGAPLSTPTGQTEVVEFFNYACPACNAFEPLLQSWLKKLPAGVHMVYVPMDFRPDFKQYAQAFYAAEALGVVEKSHEAMFAAIHQTHELPGEGQPPNAARIAKFYTRFGVKADDFQKAMDSFTVNMKNNAGRDFAMHCQVESTPTLVIDGRYRVTGKTWPDMVRIADAIVTQLRGGARKS